MILRNWTIKEEANSWRLVGQVYDHDRFEDGEWIRTATIVSFNIKTMIAHTKSGTSYDLQTMSSECALLLKRAKKRLKDYHNP